MVNAIAGANRNILAQGLEHTEKFQNRVIEQYQGIGNLDNVAHKLASEMQGKNKSPFLSLELQVTIIKAVIRKILVA